MIHMLWIFGRVKWNPSLIFTPYDPQKSSRDPLNRIRLRDYLLFNRNILIAFTAAFLTRAVTSQRIVGFTSSLINSLVSLVADVSVFLTIFSILFYRDNKHRLVNGHTQKEECGKIKCVIIKVAWTRSVAWI